jgi:hypothetical protein
MSGGGCLFGYDSKRDIVDRVTLCTTVPGIIVIGGKLGSSRCV